MHQPGHAEHLTGAAARHHDTLDHHIERGHRARRHHRRLLTCFFGVLLLTPPAVADHRQGPCRAGPGDKGSPDGARRPTASGDHRIHRHPRLWHHRRTLTGPERCLGRRSASVIPLDTRLYALIQAAVPRLVSCSSRPPGMPCPGEIPAAVRRPSPQDGPWTMTVDGRQRILPTPTGRPRITRRAGGQAAQRLRHRHPPAKPNAAMRRHKPANLRARATQTGAAGSVRCGHLCSRLVLRQN